MDYENLCGEALSSNYGRTDVFDQHLTLRLATAVVNRSEQISDAIATKEHTFWFEERVEEGSDGSGAAALPVAEIATMAVEDGNGNLEGAVQIRTVLDHPELEDLVFPAQKLPEPRSGSFRVWLKNVYRNSRGFEIGTQNSSLLAVTMKHQSAKWKDLAMGYISDIITMVHEFIVDLLHVVCPIKRVRAGIMSLLIYPLMEKY